MQTQKIIEQLGYTPNEAKVYLTALQLGECHVSDIASKLKLPRSSVQVIVDTLHKNGLLTFYIKNRYKYWVAEHPDHLLEQLKKREDMVRDALPKLEAMRQRKDSGKPLVKIFTGAEEIAHIYDDIIETKQHILGIVPEDNFLELFAGTTTIEDYVARRARYFLRARVLVPRTPAGEKLYADSRSGKALREVRILPNHIKIPTASFVYGNKVAFIIFNRLQPTGVLIEDADIRETNTVLFEELWDRSLSA